VKKKENLINGSNLKDVECFIRIDKYLLFVST